MTGRKVSAEDHGAWVSIVTGVFMTYTLFFLLARMLMRFTINGPFLKDDAIVTVATIFATIQSALKLSETESGLGKRLKNVSSTSIAEINQASIIVFRQFTHSLTVADGVCLGTLLPHCLDLIEDRRMCSDRTSLAPARPSNCNSLGIFNCYSMGDGIYTRGWDPVSWSGAMGPAVNRVSKYVWGLHMSRQPKLIVVFAFTFRLPVIIASALRIYYLDTLFGHNDPIFHGVCASVCMEAELHYSLIASTIPCLKPFMKSFNTGYLSHRAQQTAFGGTGHSTSYPLTSISTQHGMDGSESQVRSTVHADRDSIGAPADENGYDSGSNGSEKMIIKCTTSWDVSYTTASKH
ncbi:hypothetical protein PHISCL_06662 [Aspergillus sclerotialis]|uniref:Rhodopsin domain-containing protein n=1 Tax=Aspergillus sclerotialis TaxID=2070753 RepID=A0A3A2ZCW5_9EURO|nr:hypothetical protein PHISCL_06662 [Aspergillus sclerotialis]